MRKNSYFTVDLLWTRDGDDDDSVLVCSGSMTPFYPSVMYLSNGDPGYPAEGGEIEDLEIHVKRGHKLDDSEVGSLMDDDKFLEALYEKVADCLSSKEADEAEYRRDCIQDR